MVWHDSGHMFGIGEIWMLIFWILVIIWFLWLVNSIASQTKNNREAPSFSYHSAKNIVKERFARGEISREEYQHLMQDLKQ